MFRYIILLLLFIHGMIHSLGFLKGFELDKISEILKKMVTGFSKNISRFSGIMWLLSSVIFLFTLVVLLINVDWWWIPCIGGVFLSQILIISYWQYAKYGSVINMILLLVIIVSYANWSFNKTISKKHREFSSNIESFDSVVMKKNYHRRNDGNRN